MNAEAKAAIARPDAETHWHQFDQARQVMMRRFAEALHYAPQSRQDAQGEIDGTQRAMTSLLEVTAPMAAEQGQPA